MNEPRIKNKAEGLDLAGEAWDSLADRLSQRRGEHQDLEWTSLRNLKASYNAGEDVARVSWEAYTMFRGDNFLYGSSLYPSLPGIADEVVGMAVDLLNGPEDASGTVTTGGTESILLAVRSALNWANEHRPVPGRPQIVVPETGHAAFTKAAELMGLAILRVPIRDYRADPEAMAAAITENTIMLVGSAFAYPLGFVDPIKALSDLALQHDLWLHVDSCVGGFFLPFAAELGHPVPAFDFSLPGVTSLSADLHKYGYSARGASLLLIRDKALLRHQGFRFDDWPTGRFDTPTIAGSRPAGAVVSAWAVMRYLGRQGYLERVEKILAAKQRFIAAVAGIEGVTTCGEPEGGILGFRSDGDLDMVAVHDAMTERGWRSGALVSPPGFQILLNYRHGEIVDQFASDLAEVALAVRKGEVTARGLDRSYGA